MKKYHVPELLKDYKAEVMYATDKHGDQTRKYTNAPYVWHPIEVACMLACIGAPAHVVRAGLFHDLIEDTDVTAANLGARFGFNTSDLILEVTDVSKPEDGNRATRKWLDRQHLAKASYWAQNIKLCDLIDNCRTIVKHDKHFARVYLKEKRALLEVLNDCNLLLKVYAQDILTLSEQALPLHVID